MPKIKCKIEEIELDGDYGQDLVPSVSATCPKCGYSTESYGTEEDSIKRCLVLLNRGCPRGEKNLYTKD